MDEASMRESEEMGKKPNAHRPHVTSEQVDILTHISLL